jgi:hypothetical protein
VSAPWLLLAAEVGMDLFAARSQLKQAGRAAGFGIGMARLEGAMERMQLQRSARDDAAARVSNLRSVTGAQRAALGAAGVAGGRTARLLELDSQLQFRRAQDAADFQTRMATTASEFRERTTISSMRAQARQAGRQAQVDMFGSILRAGQQGRQILQTSAAGGP